MELNQVLNAVSRSPIRFLFGNGRLSHKWESKSRESFGHFSPMDIGWLGIVFLYGFLGLILVNLAFLFAFQLSRNDEQESGDPYLNSLKWWLVYLFLRSILNGIVVANPAVVLVPLFLVYWHRLENKNGGLTQKEERML